LVCI
ncbi:hypothetical protein BN1723_013317, partial [Verticillium longisporum]